MSGIKEVTSGRPLSARTGAFEPLVMFFGLTIVLPLSRPWMNDIFQDLISKESSVFT